MQTLAKESLAKHVLVEARHMQLIREVSSSIFEFDQHILRISVRRMLRSNAGVGVVNAKETTTQ